MCRFAGRNGPFGAPGRHVFPYACASGSCNQGVGACGKRIGVAHQINPGGSLGVKKLFLGVKELFLGVKELGGVKELRQ